MDASVPTSLLLLLLALPPSRPWPSSQRQRGVRGVTSWPSPQQGGVIANVQVHHLGHSGLRSHQVDLTPAAQTYYEHVDSRTPHQPVSAYRLQQHHPPAVQYAASTEAITTTYAPPYYTEQPTVRAPPPQYVQADSTTQPSYQQLSYQQPGHQQPSHPQHSHPQPGHQQPSHPQHSHQQHSHQQHSHQQAKSLLKSNDSPDIHHELQLTLSQQIQVQLEQLQKLHELQNKMLRGKTTTEQPAQVVQQGSENVGRQVLQPEHAVVYAPQTPAPFPQHVTPGSPVVYASPQPSATPAPPPLVEPRYPEESQSLTSFIGEPSTPPPPVGGAISNGFQPMLPPRRHPAADGAGDATDFQPFTEHATDPALPYYLLPPAADSDSEFNRLPAAQAGELEDAEHLESPSGPSAPASSVSSEHDDVEHLEHPIGHSVRGKHRLRPPRGKGGMGGKGGRGAHAMTQPLRKHCGSIAASLGAPCRLAAWPTTTTTRRPTATPTGATAAGSAVRLRIASPRIRFRDAVDPRAPLTLMARHPGGPGRPPVTVLHAVHKIRIIKKV